MRVIVEGNIGSGKTTLLASLAKEPWCAAVHPEPVHEWTDILDQFYKDPAKWAPAFSLRVLASHNRPAPPPSTIEVVERSPLSCRHVFTRLLFNDGILPQHQWDLFREYYDVLGWEPTADDLILFVQTPVELCLQRIAARGRACEESIDIQYLRRLEFQYDNMLKYCASPVIRLDGQHAPPALHAEACSAILSAILRGSRKPTSSPE